MVSQEEFVVYFVSNEDNTDYQTTRKSYCSKLDSSISTNRVVRGLSKKRSRRRGRRLQARRRNRGLSQGVKGDRELLLVEEGEDLVVEGRDPKGVASLDLPAYVCLAAFLSHAHLHASNI